MAECIETRGIAGSQVTLYGEYPHFIIITLSYVFKILNLIISERVLSIFYCKQERSTKVNALLVAQ